MTLRHQVPLQALTATLAQHMALYGYEAFDTPLIQSAELFLTRAGDQMFNRLLTFERRGQQLALRPEFTASAAHAYISRPPETSIARWQFAGMVFEDMVGANSQQRYSVGAELIGMSGAIADAEVIAMAALGLDQVPTDYILYLGNVQLMRALLAGFEIDTRTQRMLLHHVSLLRKEGKTAVIAALERLLPVRPHSNPHEATAPSTQLNAEEMLDVVLDATEGGGTMGGRTRQDIARRLVQKRQRATEWTQILAAIDFLERWCAIEAQPQAAFRMIDEVAKRGLQDAETNRIYQTWQQVIMLLTQSYGIEAERLVLYPSLERNWDYYTGVVFEMRSTLAADAIVYGGGGRYDELGRLLGSLRDIPAIGFAYYADTLVKHDLKSAAHQPDYVLTSAPQQEIAISLWAQRLRSAGNEVVILPNRAANSETWQAINADELRTLEGTRVLRWNEAEQTIESSIAQEAR